MRPSLAERISCEGFLLPAQDRPARACGRSWFETARYLEERLVITERRGGVFEAEVELVDVGHKG